MDSTKLRDRRCVPENVHTTKLSNGLRNMLTLCREYRAGVAEGLPQQYAMGHFVKHQSDNGQVTFFCQE